MTLEDGPPWSRCGSRTRYKPIYRDATVLLRPKTGLKDMFLALDPGTAERRRPPRGRPRAGGEHAPGRERRRDPGAARRRHARLPADPAERRRHGVRRRGTGASGATSRRPSRTCARPSSASSRRRATARSFTRLLIERRQQHQARDPQLPAAVDGAGAPRPPARRARGLRQRELPGVRLRAGGAARGAARVPGRARADRYDAAKAGGLANELGPGASAAAAVRARAGAGAPQDAAVLQRDHADHPRPDPPVRP